eukprot:7387840-Prymnesium_polylepis.1
MASALSGRGHALGPITARHEASLGLATTSKKGSTILREHSEVLPEDDRENSEDDGCVDVDERQGSIRAANASNVVDVVACIVEDHKEQGLQCPHRHCWCTDDEEERDGGRQEERGEHHIDR